MVDSLFTNPNVGSGMCEHGIHAIFGAPTAPAPQCNLTTYTHELTLPQANPAALRTLNGVSVAGSNSNTRQSGWQQHIK